MNIKELLQMPEFDGFKLLTGNIDNNRNITSVNVIDSPDSYLYFKGGEFLLTNAYIMKDAPEILKDIIEQSAKIGVAGIGIKLERFISEVPENILALAERLDFPIIALPLQIAFVDIIYPVLRNIVNEQLIQLEYSEKIHKSFTQLVLNGGSNQEIVDTLSLLIKKKIRYYDLYFGEIYYSQNSGTESKPAGASEALKTILADNDGYLLEVDKRRYGYIVVMREDSADCSEEAVINQEFIKIAVEHAGSVLKLNTQKQISNHQIESKYRDEFIQGLLLNAFSSYKEIKSRAAWYGWDFSNQVVVAVIDIRGALGKDRDKYLEPLTDFIKLHVRKVFPNSAYTKLGEYMVFLLDTVTFGKSSFDAIIKESAQKLIEQLAEKYNLQTLIGIGGYKSDLQFIHESYNEAVQSLKISKQIGSQMMFYDDIGLYKLLLPLAADEMSDEFCEKCLGKLIRYDENNQTNYLHTLRMISENGWNLKAAASELFLHYNTLKNRYYKIEEILESDLNDANIRVDVAVALKLLDLKN
ncbi:MAG: PucR family transcriptional regulator [Bacillota bacterium]